MFNFLPISSYFSTFCKNVLLWFFSLSLFISPSILLFHLDSLFFLFFAFFNSICSATHTIATLIKLFVSAMFLAFQIFDRVINSICLNLQNLLVHFLKHNGIVCSSFHHYFLQLFNSRPMFLTLISLNITNAIFCIIHFFCNYANISLQCLYFHCYMLFSIKFTLGFIFYLSFYCL